MPKQKQAIPPPIIKTFHIEMEINSGAGGWKYPPEGSSENGNFRGETMGQAFDAMLVRIGNPAAGKTFKIGPVDKLKIKEITLNNFSIEQKTKE